jgi:hypothetical protein
MSDRIFLGLGGLSLAFIVAVTIDYGCSAAIPHGSTTIAKVQHISQYVETTYIRSGEILIPVTDVHPEHWVGTAYFDGGRVSISSDVEIKTGDRVEIEERIGRLFNYGYRARLP